MLKHIALVPMHSDIIIEGVTRRVEGVRRWSMFEYVIYFEDMSRLIVPNKFEVEVPEKVKV